MVFLAGTGGGGLELVAMEGPIVKVRNMLDYRIAKVWKTFWTFPRSPFLFASPAKCVQADKPRPHRVLLHRCESRERQPP